MTDEERKAVYLAAVQRMRKRWKTELYFLKKKKGSKYVDIREIQLIAELVCDLEELYA